MKNPKVFLCYAKRDRNAAEAIFDYLQANDVRPWMDERSLTLGVAWELQIRAALKSANAVLVCLRPGFEKIGFRQQEVHWAIEESKRRPPGQSFIIPFILEPCVLPDWIAPFHAGRPRVRTKFPEILKSLQTNFGWRPALRVREWSRDDIGTRLTELVDSPRKRSPFYVAIGEADFVRAWLSRVLRSTSLQNRPAISKIVLLGLCPTAARKLEKEGRLRDGFTQTMLQNVKAIQTDPELLRRAIYVEWRAWQGEPRFHGFLCMDVILLGDWKTDDRGHLHYMTAVTELHRNDNPAKYSNVLRAFKTAPIQA